MPINWWVTIIISPRTSTDFLFLLLKILFHLCAQKVQLGGEHTATCLLTHTSLASVPVKCAECVIGLETPKGGRSSAQKLRNTIWRHKWWNGRNALTANILKEVQGTGSKEPDVSAWSSWGGFREGACESSLDSKLIKQQKERNMWGEEIAGAETQGDKNPDLFTVGGNVTGVALWKTVWMLLKKLKIVCMYVWSRCMIQQFPLLGIHPKEMKTGYRKEACTPMFMAALFTVAKTWRQSTCPSIDEWIEKLPPPHTLFSHEKKEILHFAAIWMNLKEYYS